MGKFDGIVVLSDMDGTLLNNGILASEQLEAVKYFVQNGGLFCPATGRAEGYLREHYPSLPLQTYCIVKNGTAIYDPLSDQLVWRCTMGRQVLQRMLDVFHRFKQAVKITVHLEKELLEFERSQPDVESQLMAIDQPIFKVVFSVDNADAQTLFEYYKDGCDFQYTCSADFLFEVLPIGAGKGVCVNKIRKLLGKRAKCMIGIGDYANDISLLQAADIGVAVDKAYLPLQKYADWIAPPIEHHPWMWLTKKIEKELCKLK